MPKIEIKCDYCNKKINQYPSQIKKSAHHFCSAKCYGRWKRKRYVVKCANCGKEIERYSSRLKKFNHQFCSKSCYSKFRENKIEVDCEHCGKRFRKYPSKIQIRKHHFCSKECASKWRKGKRFSVRTEFKKGMIPWDKGIKRKDMQGERHPLWKGGDVAVKCHICEKTIVINRHKFENQEHYFCSRKCQLKYLHKCISGENNYFYGKLHSKESRKKMSESLKKLYASGHKSWNKGLTAMDDKRILAGENSPTWNGGVEPYYGENWTKQKKQVLERDNYRCRICGKGKEEIGRHPCVHHIIPLRTFDSWQEANKLSNLILLCFKCHAIVENSKIYSMEGILSKN